MAKTSDYLKRPPPLRVYALGGAVQLLSRLGGKKLLLKAIFRKMFGQRLGEETFRGYKPTEHDVFIATFAKSGTNWAMQIALQISYRGDAEFEHIHDLVPWPEAPIRELAVALDDPTPQRLSSTGHRVIKTHLYANYVPYDERATYVTVLRDPKDVIVSAYHFLLDILGIKARISPQEWFDLCIAPGRFIDAWAEHAASFWAWHHRPNVMVVTFNEMKADLEGHVEQIRALMGVPLEEDVFAQVVERSSFPYMKARNEKFSPPRLPFSSSQGELIRSGKARSSGELLTPAQQARVDQVAKASLARLGSDFPYDARFGG